MDKWLLETGGIALRFYFLAAFTISSLWSIFTKQNDLSKRGSQLVAIRHSCRVETIDHLLGKEDM